MIVNSVFSRRIIVISFLFSSFSSVAQANFVNNFLGLIDRYNCISAGLSDSHQSPKLKEALHMCEIKYPLDKSNNGINEGRVIIPVVTVPELPQVSPPITPIVPIPTR